MKTQRIILGIDPGLTNTGWGIVSQRGGKLTCVAYGCVHTSPSQELTVRLAKIHEQIKAVVARFEPVCVGIETVWFGTNVNTAFNTGQGRGAALAAVGATCSEIHEFAPNQIKAAVVGQGTAGKEQVQYMVKQILELDAIPEPDHAADALAAAICVTAFNPAGSTRYEKVKKEYR